MVRSLATALRRCASNDVTPAEQRDLLAFMALVLSDIDQSVDQAAAAWEKRGYWLKADQFRRQWGWVGRGREGLEKALHADDMASAAEAAAGLATSLAGIEAKATRTRDGGWDGAWERWQSFRRPAAEPRRTNT